MLIEFIAERRDVSVEPQTHREQMWQERVALVEEGQEQVLGLSFHVTVTQCLGLSVLQRFLRFQGELVGVQLSPLVPSSLDAAGPIGPLVALHSLVQRWEIMGSRKASGPTARTIPASVVGLDVEPYVERIEEYARMGFTHIFLHHVGADQEPLLQPSARELIPAVRDIQEQGAVSGRRGQTTRTLPKWASRRRVRRRRSDERVGRDLARHDSRAKEAQSRDRV